MTSFHTITINFITDIPPARNSYIDNTCDAILILINKLTKHVTYIVTIKELKVNELTNIIWREFMSLRDIIRNLISDRDSLFTNKF